MTTTERSSEATIIEMEPHRPVPTKPAQASTTAPASPSSPASVVHLHEAAHALAPKYDHVAWQTTKMVFWGCMLGLLGVGAILLVVLQGPDYTKAHVIIALLFFALAQLPSVTAILFALMQTVKMGFVHMGFIVAMAVLACGGLLTNIRVVDESSMSEFCESHHLAISCKWSTDLATFLTLVLIAIVSVIAVIAVLSARKAATFYRAHHVYAEAPTTPDSASPGHHSV